MHPSTGLEREYLVRVRGRVEDSVLDRLHAGIGLDGRTARFESVSRTGGGEWPKSMVPCRIKGRPLPGGEADVGGGRMPGVEVKTDPLRQRTAASQSETGKLAETGTGSNKKITTGRRSDRGCRRRVF